MRGAREYAELFGESKQYGKLYLKVGYHARGKTFQIYVTPTDATVCIGSDMVEVYGITDGQPGWTETYGWLHKGPWENDFIKLVETTKSVRDATAKADKVKRDALIEEREARTKKLLSAY